MTFKLPVPNYTQVPNVFLDEWLPYFNQVETKVLLVIMRKTFGGQKTRDRISLSQLEISTGSSRQAILRATKSLQTKKLITKIVVGKKGEQCTYYELVITVKCDKNRSDR